MAGERVVAHETVRIKKDGTPVDVSFTLSPIRDSSGRLAGVSAIIGDVTERKRAEKAAQQLAAIVESSDDAIAAATLDGIMTDWNPGAERLYGYTAKEIIGQHVSILQSPDMPETDGRLRKRVMAGERVVAHETVGIKKDGTSVDVSFTLSPIKDSSGRLIGTSAIVRDITERKRADRAAQQLAAIVESSTDAIAATTLDGIVTDWNPGAERLYGYSAEEIIGQSIAKLVPDQYHDECSRLSSQIIAGGRVDNHETVRIKMDGGLIHISLSLSPINDRSGKLIGISRIGRNITERKRAEKAVQQLATIVNSSDDAITATTMDGIVTDWNPGAERVFGYTVEEMIGQPISRLYPPEYGDACANLFSQLVEEGHLDSYEMVRIKKDGTPIHVSLSLSLIKDRAGKVTGFSGIGRDITDKKRAEEQLQASLVQMRTILETAADGIITADEEGMIRTFNPAAESIFGYTASEVVGEN